MLCVQSDFFFSLRELYVMSNQMPCLSQVGGNYFYGQKRFFPNIDFLRSRII